MNLQQILALLPATATNTRAALTNIAKYWPGELASWTPAQINSWIGTLKTGANTDDALRDFFFGQVGAAKIAATLGVNATTAQQIILGKNEGGQNLNDVLQLPKVQARIASLSKPGGPLGTPAAPKPPGTPAAPKPPAPPPPPGPVVPTNPPPNTNPPAATPVDWKAKVRAYYPWLPENLVGMFADSWSETGDPTLALADVRASSEYDQIFPGIKRSDGTLRMSEQEWFSTREAYGTLFRGYGLNDTLFTDRFTELMEGDVSPSELSARLGGAYSQIIGNMEGVRQAYGNFFGNGQMTDQAIFASFLDPTIADDILNRRISIAQVAGEGIQRGFNPNEQFAERLVSGGVDQQAARAFWVSADNQLQTLDTLVRRHHDPDDTFDIEEFANANIFGDAAETRRIRRALNAEAASFTGGGVGTISTADDLAVSGLYQR